jgi:uncharacterized repeat protein (TIGR01451 family)
MNLPLQRSKSIRYRLIVLMAIVATAFGAQAPSNVIAQSTAAPLAASTNTMMLQVINATDSAPITNYQYIINEDNTGTTVQRGPAPGTGCSPQDAGYPGSCDWVSIAGAESNSPILTQGDQGDFSGGMNLPDGRYLISVLADGYKIDGAHFTIPFTASNLVTVQMQPYDLPDGTIQAAVFEDMAPTNSAPDVPGERGIAGFAGHITDYIDEVTTNVYGDPLCGNSHCVSQCYVVANGLDIGTVDPIDANGRCPIAFTTAEDPLLGANLTHTNEGDPIPVGAVIEGKLIIPGLGPNRYALSVVPPNGSGWIQTTTLEGNHDWDSWVMEGSTGLDTEFVVGGEPFPAVFFGYVRPSVNTMGSGNGTIHGTALAVSAYIPPTGGIGGETGLLGAKPKDKNPIHRLFVSLSDINNGDQTVFVKEFDCNAACDPVNFSIPNVPSGDYVLGLWDEPQDYIFFEQNVSVSAGETVDLGALSMLGWWTTLEGHVFNDLNSNGKMDDGEPGIPNFPVVMRTRENSIMDRGATLVTTDASGYYWMENAYPITQWLVEEAYADGFQTTGITYQADNQPTETTILGQGVDVNVHPVIGLGGRLDWGVKAYDPGTNGGIVGTISYDTTRNELDPSYAAIEDWQPSIAGLVVDLYVPVDCPYDTEGNQLAPCDPTGLYQLDSDGSYSRGQLLNQYTSETWERPSGCVARNVDGNPLVHGVDEDVLPTGDDAPCIEAPMMGVQFGPMSDGTNFGASVDGNYGFGDGCFGAGGFDATTGACADGSDPTSLPSNKDYLVRVEIPTETDLYGPAAVHPDRPLYKVTREEDINIGNGDSIVPQIPPPACAGALHTVDVAGMGTDGYGLVDLFGDGSVIVPASTPTVNSTFADIGGSPYEGQQKPLCDTKLVHLGDRKSIAPGFNLFTDVPLPGRFWGLIVDDLNFSSNPKSEAYGEKLPVSFAPVGIYDYTNRLIDTVESDYNGLWDVLLPSTNRINCPTPSGVCANLYRFVGNDPGTPGHWNANYNPQYRSIAAEFEAFPGLTLPADLAPTPVAVAVQIPGGQTSTPVMCTADNAQPQLLAVSRPYADVSSGSDSFTIDGYGFGAATGQVLLDGALLPTTSWNDSHIAVSVPAGTAGGSHQLSIQAANGKKTVNGLSFYVFSSGYSEPTGFPANNTPLDPFTGRSGLGPNWSSVGTGITVVNNAGTSNDYMRIRTNNSTVRNAWWKAGFGTNQEAYVTFKQYSGNPAATEQGLLLKYNGSSSSSPNANSARWIAVTVNNNNSTDAEGETVNVLTKLSNTTITNQLSITNSFADGDQIGARALSSGTIVVYKNGSEIGRVTVPATAGMSGNIGVRVANVGSSAALESRLDDFGGGNVSLVNNSSNNPSLFEVGPGHPYGTIQSAIDAAASQSPYKNSLVVVYPGAVDNTNPRYNGRGAYYENPIMYAPVKLQGVGPGGVRPDGSIVQGSIIDGIAFGGDTNLATDWLTKISSLTWDGNQDVNDGQVIYVLASDSGSSNLNRAGSFSSTTFKASIDGFDIRGGDQQGLPGNLNAIFGGFPGPIQALQIDTQGGAIFANSFVRNLQVTNNVIESNAGSYGTIRIGTPNLPNDPTTLANESDNQNDNVRVANNRILANGGSNLAGAIGLFNGAENYEVAGNDICGNFSAEYGGGISHFGYSPNGKIHDNRIYFNHSYDEGAGIMIAGELAADPNANYGSPAGAKGSGPVDIYNNLIQANMSEDDGGGLRFLMAGNFPMNVYNNMIVNNISMHEGGGVALDDAPSVNFYNNTVMKNVTTATAITSNGQPAPAGLSTGLNSSQLQSTLPGGSALFSNPLLFNNIFWDNRAGTKGINMVTGIGAAGDPNPVYNWDMGVFDGGGLLSPTSSIYQDGMGVNPSGTNASGDPSVLNSIDIPLTFSSWRTNVNFVGAIMVTADLPPNLLSNYHLNNGSPAVDLGAASKSPVNAPSFDIDQDVRPGGAGYEAGADELSSPKADLTITMTDNVTTVDPGAALTYIISVSNLGPNATTATVADSFNANLTNVSWSCAASSGSSCTGAGTGNINQTVSLAAGGSMNFTVSATLSGSASGSLVNTATVTNIGTADPNAANNSATDTDSISSSTPNKHIGDLDWTSNNSFFGNWIATVTVTVHNVSHNPVQNATVSGTWSGGGLFGTSCTTNSSGTCTLTRTTIPGSQSSNTFNVTNITGASSQGAYAAANNHDPDSGAQASSGTSITASHP